MKPTKRLPGEFIAMGIGLGFSIAATGCAFLVDFGYDVEGQGGGATSTLAAESSSAAGGASSSSGGGAGSGGGAAECVNTCGACLVGLPDDAASCGSLQASPTADAGYQVSFSGFPPVINDVVVDPGGDVFLVGTQHSPLATSLVQQSGTPHPAGFVFRVRGDGSGTGMGKRLIGCNGDQQTDDDVHLQAAARYKANQSPDSDRLVVAGAFQAPSLRLVDLDAATPCAAPQAGTEVATNPRSGSYAPFLLWLNPADLAFHTAEVLDVTDGLGPQYTFFSDVAAVDVTGAGIPGYVVALGVAKGTVTSGQAPFMAPPLLVDNYLPEYFLYAVDPDATPRRAALRPLDAGPCYDSLDEEWQFPGFDSSVSILRPIASGPAFVWFGLTKEGPACSTDQKKPADFGRVELSWNERTGFAFQSVARMELGSTRGPSEVIVEQVAALPSSQTVVVAGRYLGSLSAGGAAWLEGTPGHTTLQDGFVAAFNADSWNPEQSPRWARRIEGTSGTVSIGGLAEGSEALLVAATIPDAGALGPINPADGANTPRWCYGDDASRALVAAIQPSDGKVLAAKVLGAAVSADPWAVEASALGAGAMKAFVATRSPGPMSFTCGGQPAMFSDFPSVHLRTLSIP
jgi:hypothetical protein